jgi:hypothetical protein
MIPKQRSRIFRAIFYACLLVALSKTGAAEDGAARSADATAEKLGRGKYLVTVAACNDCHTPWVMGENGPEPDWSRLLSGHPESFEVPKPPVIADDVWVTTAAATMTAWSGPWGVSYTANLTPDRETGLGKWNTQTFRDTIRTGRHMGRGRPILPPMPIEMYRDFTDDDLDAIFTYLQSIPAISNRVPAPVPPPT